MNWRVIFLIVGLVAFYGPSFSQNCFQSSIVEPNPFMGNNGEIFQLSDGSLWEVKYEYEYLYEYFPDIVICPTQGKLLIDGKTLNVEPVAAAGGATTSTGVIESRIDGEFSGWDGETIFKLANGQIWRQSSYAYAYRYMYRPKAWIFSSNGNFVLQVEGMEQHINVVRLR